MVLPPLSVVVSVSTPSSFPRPHLPWLLYLRIQAARRRVVRRLWFVSALVVVSLSSCSLSKHALLVPKEEDYIEWFKNAGFKDVKLKRIGPKWYRGVRRHGLIMGCSLISVKPFCGDSPFKLGLKVEDVKKPLNPLVFLSRLILGAIAAS
ncbi:2-methyl-6-phytyl-1,4-hydroquinone methyltransferase, chloroplastic-like isoform X2 [Arachis ipaensis]|uniref:2-methyl-6-phytyl-1,4-hydroquinone methyltransferase, chloroplastic-like isoform X2 n=1 Tax=Arachis ipaensis TaxID=130454 RepID=UPI000A2AFC6B|nr:2-methyl-6-phytyl-1,4-hydroquinone methyltransferase, chloroplastic-like isoform X2 [Arachis ipaensis]